MLKGSYSLVLAIDGPGGSGKSTLAKKIAQKLSILYIDTGAMYRGLALAANLDSVPFQSGLKLNQFLETVNLEYGKSPQELIIVNSKNLTSEIRQHDVSTLASEFSQIPEVRHFLVTFQRELGRGQFCLMEGRDIGTVVFPDAFCKIFLTADLEVRAQRRLEELRLKGQKSLSIEQVKKDVELRDKKDMERSEAPLVQAKDAILINTSRMDISEVETKIIEVAKKRALDCGLKL